MSGCVNECWIFQKPNSVPRNDTTMTTTPCAYVFWMRINYCHLMFPDLENRVNIFWRRLLATSLGILINLLAPQINFFSFPIFLSTSLISDHPNIQ